MIKVSFGSVAEQWWKKANGQTQSSLERKRFSCERRALAESFSPQSSILRGVGLILAPHNTVLLNTRSNYTAQRAMCHWFNTERSTDLWSVSHWSIFVSYFKKWSKTWSCNHHKLGGIVLDNKGCVQENDTVILMNIICHDSICHV